MAEVITIQQAKLSDVLSFTNYGVGVINNVTNGSLIGIIAGTGLANPIAAAAEHANVYPAIPVNPANPVPNDYRKYNYWVLRLDDNSIIEVGIPWINPVTLSRLLRQTATIVINDFDPDTLTVLNTMLVAAGYINKTITVA